jgi:phytoene/squalene synthetase
MSVASCAEIVRKGDPDRFLATMATPPSVREKLFPIYAFNVEVARAPWVTQEPLIAEMRLQWWRDVLDEIAGGGPVRSHEVTVPLAGVLDAEAAQALVPVIEARKWDIGREAFARVAELEAHIEASAGRLTQVAARALGPCEAEPARDLGTAAGIAAWLVAVPRLIAAGRQPLALDDPAGAELAAIGLARLARARAARGQVSAAAAPALLVGWEAGAILTRAWREPARIASGALASSEFRRRFSLLWRSFTGRY